MQCHVMHILHYPCIALSPAMFSCLRINVTSLIFLISFILRNKKLNRASVNSLPTSVPHSQVSEKTQVSGLKKGVPDEGTFEIDHVEHQSRDHINLCS
jgi:hypothetical protein